MLKKFDTNFTPIQLGAGAKHSCEAEEHVAREFITDSKDDTVFVKIDFANAFNSVRRDVIFDMLNELMPEILSFVKLCYEENSFLTYGDFNNESAEGFQQSDPLATFGFCLVIHPLLISLNSELKTGYLDDESLGDSWRVAIENLFRFREAEKLSLSLNEQKREVKAFGSNKHDYIESTFRHHFPIIQCIPAGETTLLGAGLGQSAVRNELIDKLDKLKTLISRTYKLPARTAFFLIKNCFFFSQSLCTFSDLASRSTTVI